MKYRMRQKLWSLGDQFTIQDEHEKDAFRVEGKVFSWGDKLRFYDAAGEEVAFIKQKLLSLKPRYEIHRDGEKFAEVSKDFTLVRDRFTLDVPGPNDYTVRGNILDHEYTFERSGNEVARVSKTLFALRDVYGVDIREDEDEVAILATCVVIDLVSHDED